MFKKYPYTGWLLIAVGLWIAAVVRFYILRQVATPVAMANAVSKDMQMRQKSLDAFLANEALVKKLFTDSLTADEADELAKKPFYIYAFKGGYLLQFWNNNTVVGTCGEDFPDEHKNGLYRYNGTFYKQCLHPSFLKDDEHLVVLFPLRYRYSIQNDYLQSYFAAADYIPFSTSSSDEQLPGGYPVLKSDNTPLFYLYFQTDDLPNYIPDVWLNILFITALLSSLLWLHLLTISLARNGKRFSAIAIVAAAIAVILAVAYKYGAPFHLNETTLFSKGLFSTSLFIPSLALLLIVLFCLLWLLLFVVRNIKIPFKKSRYTFINMAAVIGGVLLLSACAIVPVSLIRKLVLDSQLSFDVTDLNAINNFTFTGLFTVILILCCNTLIIYCCNLQLNHFLPKRIVKYVLVITSLWIGYVLIKPTAACQYFFVISIFAFLFVFDSFYEKKKIKIFSPEIFIAAILIALLSTSLLYHFNSFKKKMDERAFAERVVRQRDEMMEYLFSDISDSLRKDALVRSYMEMPSRDNRSYVDEHIATRYLRGQLNRYQASLYFFNREGQPIYNADTLQLHTIDTLLSKGEEVPFTPDLYYFKDAKDGRYYIANILMEGASGRIVITLQTRQDLDAAVYPELLEPGRLQKINTKKNFTYAIYTQRELIAQNNDHPFPVYLRSDSMAIGSMRVISREGYNVNIYKVEDGKRVAIIEARESWLEMLTLFSYIVGVLMLGVITYFLLSLYIRYLFKDKHERFIQLTLRNRIHFAMLGTVMLAFLVLGIVTIVIFKDRYENTNETKLRNVMQAIERAVQEYLKKDKNVLTEAAFDEETQRTRFKNFISDFAESKKLDINIYNSFGSLNATSQEDIYNKALLARIMMPDAYYKMAQQHRTILLQEERIGKLSYLSSYVPVRNINGEAVGYINVPFFSSQRELNYQISNILVALINIYVLIFIFSSILAVSITNRLTKAFQILIDKFRTFDLKENEKIAWEYDDEIGLLLREYNKMVEKVVENAKRLAQSERESAWREMAQQVAHEIKNPLTPMKLNVQYLQQAMERNHPDMEQLTKNVSTSLIEQIDNLTHIASAFSDFAKMPEAMPEIIVLNDLIKNIQELYKHGQEATITLQTTDEPLKVYIDKNQLLRVLNNLIKNALEAIPEDRQPLVILSLAKEHGKALITVKDNGNGIDETTQQKIFSPYFTTKGSGTGLGLAMTKKIVEFWNGRVWFETEVGLGTSFFIELPLKG